MTYTFVAYIAGHARLLQRHARRPAGRDGPVRRDHRAARQRPRGLHQPDSRRSGNLRCAKRTGVKPTSGWRRPPTTTPRPATTGNICSSSPRWTRAFTARRRRRSRPRTGCAAGAAGCSLDVPTEPYHPAYFMINGRSMPDDMDPNYAAEYPHQPYNGNPHMHPGELVLLRIIGQGRWQHPFHEHANHVRILARDGNLILSRPDPDRPRRSALFTTTTTPGQAMDGIFYYTGRGLNWDMYGHNPQLEPTRTPSFPARRTPTAITPGHPTAINYLRVVPGPQQASRGRSLRRCCRRRSGDSARPQHSHQRRLVRRKSLSGPDATARATAACRTGTDAADRGTRSASNIANPAAKPALRSCGTRTTSARSPPTTSFPGGMMMMMLVDSREFVIDESN